MSFEPAPDNSRALRREGKEISSWRTSHRRAILLSLAHSRAASGLLGLLQSLRFALLVPRFRFIAQHGVHISQKLVGVR